MKQEETMANPELNALIERLPRIAKHLRKSAIQDDCLHGYTVDTQSILDAKVCDSAAVALAQLREENALLKNSPTTLALSNALEDFRVALRRISALEAEVARLKDLHKLGWAEVKCPVCDADMAMQDASIRIAALEARVKQRDQQIAVYNSGGFADADALAEKFIDLQASIAKLERERDALRAMLFKHLRGAHGGSGSASSDGAINAFIDAAIDAARSKP